MTEPAHGRLCAGPGRPHLTDNGHLCGNHLQELAGWLRDIEEEATRLTYNPADPDSWPALPSMATNRDARGSTLASQRSPAILDALAYLDPRTTIHGHRRIGPVCAWCPTLAGHRCTCPPLQWGRLTHWAHCPRHRAHPSCLSILADRDEHDAHAEQLLSVLAVLHSWAQRVRDERLMGIPTRRIIDRIPGWPGPICDNCRHHSCADMRWIRNIPIPPTITGDRDVLSRQLRWIADQDWVTDMRRELGDLRAQLLRVNRNEPDRPLPGSCPWLVDGAECGGHLWPEQEPAHTSGYASDGPLPPRAVVCGINPKHRWQGAPDLARLSLIVDTQRRKDTA